MDNSQTLKPLEMKKSMPYVFAVVAFGQGFGVVLLLQYLSFFCTEYLGMSMPSVALILTLCNSSDFVFSLITGAILQKTNTKIGQFRPWILFAPIYILCVYCVIFWGIQAPEPVMVVIITLMYGTSGFCWQVLSGSNSGLIAKVAGANPNNRLSITSKNAVGARVAGICTSAATAPFIAWGTENGVNAYFILTVIYGLLGIVPNIALFIMTKEYDKYNPDFKAPESKSNVKVSEMYLETLKNPQFLAIFIAACASAIGLNATSLLNTYYFRYSVGNFALLALSGTISQFVNMGAATIAPPLAKRLGKKKSAVYSRLAVVIINVLIAFFTDGNFVMKVILVSLNTASGAIFTAWGINYYLDAAEYQQYKTGKDMKAFVMSMSNMSARIGGLVGAPMAAWALSFTGYDAVAKTYARTDWMCLYIGFAPAIAAFIAMLIYQFGYRLTDEQAKEYAEHNARVAAEEKARVAAAAASAD